jgi:hypothetical protein
LWTTEVCTGVGEAGFLEHGFQLRFAEAQPLVGVEFARFFKAVLGEIEDDDAAAGDENAPGLLDGALGVQGVMERLREEDQIDLAVADGNLFHVAEAELDVFDAVAEGLLAADFDHLGRGVDGDDLLARWASSSAKAPSPAPRSAMTMGGIRRSSASATPFQDFPGT